ncbi:TetR/AcrR family transcriptional regulator [Novosphingobium umbonatum]|uniref:TetR/AcrR family transcriptional regulator n=1 Tax=Novosphingobium umbonatum TaxID=1908524 RepID=A0A437N733_9SPHN|nr:TetR/AcrR family transcriptional regulator [Novosphingobium umbonatum]RVU05701.1 TetR/AcrR family transcriptional regulator [Novosphingobium umbonatum]
MLSVAAAKREQTPRQIERRQRILASARDLVSQHGCDAVSMRAIAAASGVTEKTLFNIFGNKDGLLAAAAYERSASVFVLASDLVPVPGWEWLIALCDAVANVTLEAPEMARALAGAVIDHLEMTGLAQLYDRHVGQAMRAMVEQGVLAEAAPLALLSHLVQLAMVSGVGFWAKGDLWDEELRPFLHLRLAETLLSHAKSGLPAMQQTVFAAQQSLAQRFPPRL